MTGSLLFFLSLVLCCFAQDQPVSRNPGDLMSASEQRALNATDNISARCKIILEAAGRRLKAAAGHLAKEDSSPMLKELQSYRQLLEMCQNELSRIPAEKRRNLKQREITLRHFITTLDNLEARADLDDRPAIQEIVKITKELRAAFLDNFFGSNILKKP